MPQYARPTSDTSVGSWSPPPSRAGAGGSTPDDGLIIHGVGDNPCVIALSPIATPQVGTITVRVRARRHESTPTAGVSLELLSGGTPVAARTLDALTATLTTFALALTSDERASITDWSALAVRLTATALPANTVHYGTDPVLHDADPVVYGSEA